MTRLRAEQVDRVRTLAVEQTREVWRDLVRLCPDFPPLVAEPTPEVFLDLLRARHFDHAGVMRPMFRESSAIAVQTMEHLLGKPFTRPTPKMRAAPGSFNGRQSVPRARPDDNRVITAVVPNPKKQGSASYDRFAHYREGMTVKEALAAGVMTGDIKWDSERGFITLS